MLDDPKTFCEKVCSSYWNGVKDKYLPMNYYSFALSKNLLVAIAFVFIRQSAAQIASIAVVCCSMFAYVILVRPFTSVLKNLIAVVNEMCMLLSVLIMIKFIDEDNNNNKGATGYVIIGLTGVCLAMVLILGNIALGLALYTLCKTRHRRKKAESYRIKQGTQAGLDPKGNYDDEFAMSPKKYAWGNPNKDEEGSQNEEYSPKRYLKPGKTRKAFGIQTPLQAMSKHEPKEEAKVKRGIMHLQVSEGKPHYIL